MSDSLPTGVLTFGDMVIIKHGEELLLRKQFMVAVPSKEAAAQNSKPQIFLLICTQVKNTVCSSSRYVEQQMCIVAADMG